MPTLDHAAPTTSPLVVSVGRQGDGYAFELEPRSRARVREQAAQLAPAGQVFISFDTKADFESAHGPMWKQVVLMLTGMREQDLRELGGARFVDPVAGTQLAEVSF